MRRDHVGSWTGGALSVLALLLLTTCGGNSPTSPTQGATGGPSAGGSSGNSGGTAGEVGRIEILRAPADGQTFTLTSSGTLPQPAPKLRLSITSPSDVPAGYLDIELLNSGSLRCGGVLMSVSGLTAATPKVMDIANSEFLVGPNSCAYGFNCSQTQCKLPLTTVRLRVILSQDNGELVRTTEDHRYFWVEANP
jgi:hypothetical protein